MQKEIYIQICEDFRSLNNILWKTPMLAITITGGLWFAVAKFEVSSQAKAIALYFTSFLDVVFIIIIWRLRVLLGKILKRKLEFEEQPQTRGGLVVGLFALMLCASAVVSFLFAMNPQYYHQSTEAFLYCMSYVL